MNRSYFDPVSSLEFPHLVSVRSRQANKAIKMAVEQYTPNEIAIENIGFDVNITGRAMTFDIRFRHAEDAVQYKLAISDL